VVCDLNGEWASLWQGRGEYQWAGRLTNVIKITQQGNAFEGIRMIDTPYVKKGTVVIEGELDKDGFKKFLFNSNELSGS
jgi:hypothetical protein